MNPVEIISHCAWLYHRSPSLQEVEVFIKIHGKSHYLWRAVDQDGNVLDSASRVHHVV